MKFLNRTPSKLMMREARKLIRQGSIDAAIARFQRAVELEPNSSVGWGSLGWALLKTMRNEEAIAAYDAAIELKPDAVAFWYNKGVALVNLGRDEEALTAFDRACALAPFQYVYRRLQAHHSRLYTLIRLKRFDEAFAQADAILAHDPRDCASWICCGLVYAEQKRYDEAETALLKAVMLDSANAVALHELGSFYLRKVHNHAGAADASERLTALRPDGTLTWELKGAILFDDGRYQEAVSAYRHALDSNVRNVEIQAVIQCNLGLSLIHLGHFFDALEALDSSEALKPARFPLMNGRGAIQFRIERQSEALEWYDAAILADPEADAPQINKAETLEYLGRRDEAESTLNQVLEREPENFGALSVKGLFETKRGRHDNAMAAFKKSIELNPRHGPTYIDLASLLLNLDDPEHACQVAERATSLEPYFAHAWKVKTKALRAAGRVEEAASAEQRGAALLAEQTAQVDAYLAAKRD